MRAFGLTCLAAVCLAVLAGQFSVASEKQAIVQLHYGITRLDLTGEGLSGILVLSRRENFNAHGFDILSMYVEPKTTEGGAAALLIVPVFGAGQEQLDLTAGGGADCQLHDFRLLRGPGHELQLITAQRAPGKSYVDAEEVTFDYFVLEHNATEEPGRPSYYFEKKKSEQAKRKYCDVNEAFRQELGLGGYRPKSD